MGMSANIYWRPSGKVGREIETGTPSAFVSAMQQAFGGLSPWTLNERDRSKLEGMAAVYGDTSMANPYRQLCDALTTADGEITVWAEY